MRFVALLAALALMAGGVAAQTSLNPDISLIGDLRIFSHNDTLRADEREALNFADPQLELAVSGALNPYARAAVQIAWHPGADAEVEEIYAEFVRGLPLGSQVRAGKYLLEFGRLNPVHPHAWSFIQRPLPHAYFFGDHGLADMTLRVSFLLPIGAAYTELIGAVLKGDALLGHEHEHGETDAADDNEHIDPGFLLRLTSSLAVSDDAELALGVSAVNSVYERHHEDGDVKSLQQEVEPEPLRAWVSGIDLKYKYRPSRYTSLQIEAEGLWRAEETELDSYHDSYGGYAYVDYRIRQRYNFGGIIEYADRQYFREDLVGEPVLVSGDTWRTGLFVGFAPVEETSLIRLVGHWTEPDDADSFWELTLQLVFSLGPHQPHNF
jgi:hypothetical protein